jgi:hypothetical protein
MISRRASPAHQNLFPPLHVCVRVRVQGDGDVAWLVAEPGAVRTVWGSDGGAAATSGGGLAPTVVAAPKNQS